MGDNPMRQEVGALVKGVLRTRNPLTTMMDLYERAFDRVWEAREALEAAAREVGFTDEHPSLPTSRSGTGEEVQVAPSTFSAPGLVQAVMDGRVEPDMLGGDLEPLARLAEDLIVAEAILAEHRDAEKVLEDLLRRFVRERWKWLGPRIARKTVAKCPVGDDHFKIVRQRRQENGRDLVQLFRLDQDGNVVGTKPARQFSGFDISLHRIELELARLYVA
jgi:hypothetical protein